jgi:hypothetical protein
MKAGNQEGTLVTGNQEGTLVTWFSFSQMETLKPWFSTDFAFGIGVTRRKAFRREEKPV